MKLKPAKGLELDASDAITQTWAFLGLKGFGKTYAAGKLCEEILKIKGQIVVLDPVGNWYGLRLNSSGKNPSRFKIPILGGTHGDVPLEHRAGALIADFIVDTGSSALLDVSMFRKNQRKDFVTDFAEQLFHRKKDERSPLHLVLEEAQTFAPEQGRGQERMLGAIEDIVRLGRNYGLGCSMISQRPQSVNKEVLNMTQILVCFQLFAEHERAAVRKWMKHIGSDMIEELDQALPGLATGECYICSPAWLRMFKKTKFHKKITFDASATPKLGEKPRVLRSLKPVDLKGLHDAMAETIERAKANDPKALQQRIRELEKEVEIEKAFKGEFQEPVEPAINEDAIKAALADNDKYWQQEFAKRDSYWEGETDKLLKGQTELLAVIREAERVVCLNGNTFPMLKPTPPSVENMPPRTNYVPVPMKPAKPKKSPGAESVKPSHPALDSSAVKIGKGEEKILIAIAQHRDGLERSQLTALTGFATSTRNNYIQRLVRVDFVCEYEGVLDTTDAGRKYLGNSFQLLPVGRALGEYWLRELPKGEREILSLVLAVYPDSLTRNSISESTGFATSTRNNYIQRLAKRKLAVTNGTKLTASEQLFG